MVLRELLRNHLPKDHACNSWRKGRKKGKIGISIIPAPAMPTLICIGRKTPKVQWLLRGTPPSTPDRRINEFNSLSKHSATLPKTEEQRRTKETEHNKYRCRGLIAFSAHAAPRGSCGVVSNR